jgi:septum formation protein
MADLDDPQPSPLQRALPPISAELPLILASASPRRSELLSREGVPFEVRPSDIAELDRPDERPHEMTVRLASEKALSVAEAIGKDTPRWVLGADTIVVRDGLVLGKPSDPAGAIEMLSSLLGRRHRVITGIALVSSAQLEPHCSWVPSEVDMRGAEAAEVEAYVAGGEPMDKAGSYALQGEGRRFVLKVQGSESNVIGLPLGETLALMRALGALAPDEAGTDGSPQ